MKDIYIYLKNEKESIKELFNYDVISIEDVLNKLEEMSNLVSDLEDEIERIEQDIKDNYRPIPVNEQIGISDIDFI